MINQEKKDSSYGNPYIQCPEFETDDFILRLVKEEDSSDLLNCYSDQESRKLFNSDTCTSNFFYNTLAEMKECIHIWLSSYYSEDFVRFSIIDKHAKSAVGTIEIFGFVGKYKVKRGILRLDIASSYEDPASISALMSLCIKEFYDLFQITEIVTKAAPDAVIRIQVLKDLGFLPYTFPERKYYWVHGPGTSLVE